MAAIRLSAAAKADTNKTSKNDKGQTDDNTNQHNANQGIHTIEYIVVLLASSTANQISWGWNYVVGNLGGLLTAVFVRHRFHTVTISHIGATEFLKRLRQRIRFKNKLAQKGKSCQTNVCMN